VNMPLGKALIIALPAHRAVMPFSWPCALRGYAG